MERRKPLNKGKRGENNRNFPKLCLTKISIRTNARIKRGEPKLWLKI